MHHILFWEYSTNKSQIQRRRDQDWLGGRSSAEEFGKALVGSRRQKRQFVVFAGVAADLTAQAAEATSVLPAARVLS